MSRIAHRIAEELNVNVAQVNTAIALLDGGATVPFIARYRKEATDGLDDNHLRTLEERLRYLRELEERRATILNSIEEQEKLTDSLAADIKAADNKTRLEDLYLPYKPKRRTKAQIAREAGLEPLAFSLYEDPSQDPVQLANKYIDADKGINDIKAALDGAKQILMERFAEDASLLGQLRDYLWQNAVLVSKVAADKTEEGVKFTDYFDYHEALQKIPSHRALALFRGRNESILQLQLLENSAMLLEPVKPSILTQCESQVAAHVKISQRNRPADTWLQEVVRWTWRIKLRTHLEVELLMRLREAAEKEAIKVFSSNLKDLLLAAPAGAKVTIGLDPGIRTGVKVAVVDDTGKLVEHGVIYPHAPRNQWDESIQVLALLAKKFDAKLISIGNGTASRETDKLVADLMKRHPELPLQKLMVSEAGASIYSASALAAKEFPDLDVSIRGAVSIARRLQDPLAELVKIEAKAIGVGQYQHDVNQTAMARSLDAVVEDCVNAVGVDVNMASAPLLSRISGLNSTLANNIVAYRDEHGAFKNRQILLKVARLGAKTFEQAAGFLRITNGENPLDASALHPETYSVVKRMANESKKALNKIIGDTAFLRSIKIEQFINDQFGQRTIKDILQELEKPARDPRPEFKTASFQDGVETLKDLRPDMLLEGVVTNVTNFGAFIDIGVHQDGLVHISAISDKFIKDPREVVKAGDIVKVKVLEIDIKRKRVALTMRLSDSSRDHVGQNRLPSQKTKQKQAEQPALGGAFAAAFAKAKN